MLFSQRHGFKPVRETIQRESMDVHLRNGLWNVLYAWIFSREVAADRLEYSPELRSFAQKIWLDFFHGRLDQAPRHWSAVRSGVSTWFFETASWMEAYDFLEFAFTSYPERLASKEGMDASNKVLEREMSAWRFVGGRLAEVTSEAEIEAIEKALASTSQPAQTHLRAALTKLSDRTDPDYRNSIKESISAVEVVVSELTGAKTLGAGLKNLPTRLHPALEGGLSKLYGWTSSAEGIRHALMDKPSLTSEDAKFMLVSCSAFVNYLTALGTRA